MSDEKDGAQLAAEEILARIFAAFGDAVKIDAIALGEACDEVAAVISKHHPSGDVKALRDALENLYTMVKGECPSLLNEDSGGDANLDMQIEAALASVPANKERGSYLCPQCGSESHQRTGYGNEHIWKCPQCGADHEPWAKKDSASVPANPPPIAIKCPSCGGETRQDANSFECDKCQKCWPKGHGWETPQVETTLERAKKELEHIAKKFELPSQCEWELEQILEAVAHARKSQPKEGVSEGLLLAAKIARSLGPCSGTRDWNESRECTKIEVAELCERRAAESAAPGGEMEAESLRAELVRLRDVVSEQDAQSIDSVLQQQFQRKEAGK